MSEEEKHAAPAANTLPAVVVDNGEVFEFHADLSHIRINVTWQCKSRSQICDLDLSIYLFDERARCVCDKHE